MVGGEPPRQTVAMQRVRSFDGLEIAYEVVGSGPDVVLLHGFASNAVGNWINPGIRDALVASGRRVIAYDARGHGASGKPHDPAAYQNDAMRRDAQALLDRLGVERVDVVGYSMGAIVASRLVPDEPRARSLVLGGVGERLARGRSAADRSATADALIAPAGAPIADRGARLFRRFAERSGNDLVALSAIQRATLAGTPGDLGAITVPTLVVAGVDDRLAGAPDGLAARIPGAAARTIPGNHLTAVVRPELAHEIVAFLSRVSPV
jgi:pimeloyl-ACP methyl ester carboxylesterase